jgi:hypothetical protein
VLGQTRELLKTNSKNDRSRDLRSERPIFKAHGIDKDIHLFFKTLRETSLDTEMAQKPKETSITRRESERLLDCAAISERHT